MLLGPIMGSVLYESGGFMLPFFVCALLLFVLTIPICCILENDIKSEIDDEIQPQSEAREIRSALQVRLDDISEESAQELTFFSVLC